MCEADATTTLSRTSFCDNASGEAVLASRVTAAVTDTGANAVRALADAGCLHALDSMLSKVEPERPRVAEAAWSDHEREKLVRER